MFPGLFVIMSFVSCLIRRGRKRLNFEGMSKASCFAVKKPNKERTCGVCILLYDPVLSAQLSAESAYVAYPTPFSRHEQDKSGKITKNRPLFPFDTIVSAEYFK